MHPWAMRVILLLAVMVPPAVQAQPHQVDLAPYLRQAQYQQVKISPNGDYYAVITELEDRNAVAVVRRADNQPTAKITGRKDSVIEAFWWANDERIVASVANRLGSRDQPVSIGELHAIDVTGKNAQLLASPYGAAGPLDTTVQLTLQQGVYLFDTLPNDRRNVLVSAVPASRDPTVRVERLDVYTRQRSVVATPPVKRAEFVADADGQVRFATGANIDNVQKVYYRDEDAADWRLVHDAGQSGHNRYPLGFSADGTLAYLQVEHPDGPDSVVAWNPADGQTRELLRDARVDPYRILYDLDGRTPIGASFMSDRVHNRFFDDNAPTSRLYRSLERSFSGDAIHITSASADGRLAVIYSWSDRNSGDYFLFDTVNKSADRIFARREWLPPHLVPPSTLVSLKARDGLPLDAYLTRPLAAAEGPLPLVVLPHGGPYGIFDEWGFDDDAQVLAAAGYAVLRVNYRGSGNYGRRHRHAGAQQWGGTMQDDVTDATRWAIAQGIADPERICIYGASYGGYAALMGAAREPDLYQCAAGYVGVYDLTLMHRDASDRSRSTRTWAGDWIGARESLAGRSPTQLAARIKVPVFLAAGGKDERAPLVHSERMERALKQAGVPVETLYYASEGHGFYTEPHRREYYTRLLAFLSTHLGGATAKSK